MKFRKKPVMIEAVQWTGTKAAFDAILAIGLTDWKPGEIGSDTFTIQTLEGDHLARKGDWIIRGVQGEFYPCKPDIFAQTYEPAEDIANAQAHQTPERSVGGMVPPVVGTSGRKDGGQ
jgi:hypothetical protein